MKIENIIISDINVEENKSILTFDIIELKDKVNWSRVNSFFCKNVKSWSVPAEEREKM